jgi:hypothetical protein
MLFSKCVFNVQYNHCDISGMLYMYIIMLWYFMFSWNKWRNLYVKLVPEKSLDVQKHFKLLYELKFILTLYFDCLILVDGVVFNNVSVWVTSQTKVLRSWLGVLDTTLCDKVRQLLATGRWFSLGLILVDGVVFNATFNNISVITWRSVLLVQETGVPRENHRPVASNWRTLNFRAFLRSAQFF